MEETRRHRQVIWLGILTLVVGSIVSIAAIVVQNKYKQIQINVSEPAAMALVVSNSSDITVLYQDRPVKSLYTLTATIKNTGKLEILKTDFDVPITITLVNNGKLVDVSPLPSNPSKYNADATRVSESQFEITKLLLNEDDSVSFTITIADSEPEHIWQNLKFDTHIQGMSENNLKIIFEKPVSQQITTISIVSVNLITGIIIGILIAGFIPVIKLSIRKLIQRN
jgi:hypothetical protein